MLFRHARKFGFACGCAVFRRDAKFQILFGAVGDDFAQKFRKFCGVFRFFPSGFFVIQTDFGITFAVSDARHRKIHTYFAAFAVKVVDKTFFDFGIDVFCNAYDVFCRPGHFRVGFFNLEF